MNTETIIAQTKKWITDVVVACNFCPFAAREVKRNTIHFEAIEQDKVSAVLERFSTICKKLDVDNAIETAFLILPRNFDSFASYLKLLDAAELKLRKEGYEGIYQVASFHPAYLFAGSSPNDPANYTNRSPYPMLHILREASVSKAIDHYPDTHLIPEKNMAFSREKGLAYMQALKAACMEAKT